MKGRSVHATPWDERGRDPPGVAIRHPLGGVTGDCIGTRVAGLGRRSWDSTVTQPSPLSSRVYPQVWQLSTGLYRHRIWTLPARLAVIPGTLPSHTNS